MGSRRIHTILPHHTGQGDGLGWERAPGWRPCYLEQMPYCPVCKSEFESGIERCSDCGAPLVENLPDQEPAPLVEVFRAESQAAAERVCAVILDGLECFVRDRSSRAFPTDSMGKGLSFVAVPGEHVERALTLIKDAVQDGALTEADGEPLDPEEVDVVEETGEDEKGVEV